MAQESVNGSEPTRSGADPLKDDDGAANAFERFEQMTRKLVNTPKSEVDERLERAKRQKRATSSRS